MGWRSRGRGKEFNLYSLKAAARNQYPGDSILVPFRFVEAVRVSMHTICEQPEVPAEVRAWIATWLRLYNAQLVTYMQQAYGPNIMPVLDQITKDVVPEDFSNGQEGAERNPSWEEWESQFVEKDGGDDKE